MKRMLDKLKNAELHIVREVTLKESFLNSKGLL